ncbi:hypothetical protein HPP92_023078 [Vanilla planifolia]|uniref:Undecaprenyldiphospho-muramoylpentapeptide beta-N-acetylglucosaminyltransferase n=1 Tax=Vanilla planifolia TaxID=51239 RepID=A0A835PTF9_VANPL|nr:hypothetical protein HPP92_023400 [Vanilla planifolia]KAG0459950.1 hypothetical protein HPP92_023078 [Vanilla planifolia]
MAFHLTPSIPFLISAEKAKGNPLLQSYLSPRCRLLFPFSLCRTRHVRLHSCPTIDHGYEVSSASTASTSDTAPLRFLFTGGGSGGHIYPAIAVADEIRNLSPNAKFLYVGTSSGLESNVVPSAGYDLVTVPASRLVRPLLSPQNFLVPFRLIRAIAAAWLILRQFRPHVVVGTGGFVSAPVYLAAAISGIKIAIQEQNVFPGVSNKIVSAIAAKIFLAFDACLKHFPKEKCLVYGNPVRLSLRRNVSKAVARSHFFPDALKCGNEKAQVVLVLGGSQGASTISVAVLNMYYDMLLKNKNRYIIWQTGQEGFSKMESLVKSHPRLLLTPFLNAMDLAYAAADVVVSRAGAMTCTEILITGKPAILIPSPYVAEDHQTNNACIMVDVAGSKILTEDELDSTSLAAVVEELLGDENLMRAISEKALKAALPNAATNIAESILSLVNI